MVFYVPVAAAVTTKHRENAAVISSYNGLFYLMALVANVMHGQTTCFVSPYRGRDLLRKQGI